MSIRQRERQNFGAKEKKIKEDNKEIIYAEFFFFFNGKLILLYVSDSHLTRVNFLSQGILSKVWRFFGLSQLGRNESATGT